MTEHHSHKIAHIHHELHSHLPSDPALRVKALESLLIEKDLVDPRTVDAWIEVYTEEIGPKRGAQVVARAWADPAFKLRLLKNGTEAIKEFGFEGNATGHLRVLENTPLIHNLVVCTLCSCYPHSILGIQPNWYKTAAFVGCKIWLRWRVGINRSLAVMYCLLLKLRAAPPPLSCRLWKNGVREETHKLMR